MVASSGFAAAVVPFTYEIEEKGKRKTLGWFDTKKLGPHRVQCNAIHADAGIRHHPV